MTHSEMPSIGICLPWWSGCSGRDREGCRRRIGIVLDDVLLVDLFNIENGLRGLLLLDSKVNIVPMISSLPELPVRDDINMEARDECNVS